MTVDDLRNYPCPGTLIIKVAVNEKDDDKSVEIVGLNSTYNILHLKIK